MEPRDPRPVSSRTDGNLRYPRLHGLSGDCLLGLAAEGSPERLSKLLEAWNDGAPAAYLAGFFYFLGHRFYIDKRAYITDPEAEFLVASVVEAARELGRAAGQPPKILELGTGAGTLAICVKLAIPEAVVYGSDIDAEALEVARENLHRHHTEVELLQGNLLAAWTEAEPPDLIFVDPPWGTREDLYDDERNAVFYDQMPKLSAYPEGGRTGLHEAIVADLQVRGWSSQLLMNFGVIDKETVARVVAPLSTSLKHPAPQVTIADCRVSRS